jgi:UDP-N-acetylmuramate dehydrogenase
MKMQQNVRLAPYTTMQVGGNAAYFAEPANDDEIIEGLRWARSRSLPVFVLGGGSNVLVSDDGFPGLVLHMTIGGVSISESGKKHIYSAGAGIHWDSLVVRAVANNCAGIECLSGIPGSVGGTPVQNVGAYGQDVSETIVRVCAIDTSTLHPVEFGQAACGFHYRQSRFNTRDLGRYIITRVDYALRPCGSPNVAYADLKYYFNTSPRDTTAPTLAETREAVLEIRRRKGMVLDDGDPDSRSAGSFFKNPVVSLAEYERIAASYSEAVPHFDAGSGRVKLAAAWLIEHAGLQKGFAIGPAAISSKHTLALVNHGLATAADILCLKEFVQRRVRQCFAIELQPEPVMLGFDDPL